ncbi:hypothetical protein EHQ81_15745 [Leptospira selangorensis]|uniref:Peptidase A1 domain-containing protein n=1 Tax=Leptospira selangorensis TaxID=2484982 RepID=A0A4R9FWI8_9LEPT|nr:hypothetical protein EHO58_17730 [Leptospira selangorensis]TGM11137.1 hypothetical protein EHQ81_15745 [Leptospira selangorensis]TGM18994.1 hypothetical protein EHQ82_11070 [Leptospira selangorensis]
MRLLLNLKTFTPSLFLLLTLACSNNGDTTSTDDTAASLLYSAYGASFTPVPTGGCADSAVPTIVTGGTATFSGASYYYYFYSFTGNGATNTFNVSFTSGEADLWIGTENSVLIPTDFSQVEVRSENIGTESYSGISTTNGSTRCLVIPVTDAGTITLSVQ